MEKTIGIQTLILLIGFFLAGIGFLECMFFDPVICSRLCNMCRVLRFTSALYFHETLSILEPNYYSDRKDGTRTSYKKKLR